MYINSTEYILQDHRSSMNYDLVVVSSVMFISLAVDRLMFFLVLDIGDIPTVVISHVVGYHLTPAIRKVHIVVTLNNKNIKI